MFLVAGVEKVHANTAPRELCMRPGRLNLTMRQYDVSRSGKA